MMKSAPPKQKLSAGNERSTMDELTEIGVNDVLLGRGAGPNEHTGNIAFRVIVAKQKAVYMATTNRQEKNKIALKTMQIVQAQKGRFLQKPKERDGNDDDLYEIAADKVVLEKIKQALRHLDRAKGSKSDTRKEQETIKLSGPLQHQGVGPAQEVGPLLNAFLLLQQEQDANITAQRRSAAFSFRAEQDYYSDLPIVSPRSSYSQLSARDINAAAASLGIQRTEAPNRSSLPTTATDNLRHLGFQEQLNTALLATCSHQDQDRERENQAVAKAIALMDARRSANSADDTILGSLLKEYAVGGLSTIATSPGINQSSPINSPFSPRRGMTRSTPPLGSTTDLMPRPLDQLSRLVLGANNRNPPGSSPVNSLENKMYNFYGAGNGLEQSSSLQPTASSYLGNQNRGLQQQGDHHDQAAVAALRDSSARVMEVLALLGRKHSTC
jgi:hypothetical protein